MLRQNTPKYQDKSPRIGPPSFLPFCCLGSSNCLAALVFTVLSRNMKPHSSHWLDTRQGSLSQSWGPYVKLPNEFRAGGIHLRTQNNRFTLMIGFVGKWSLWRDCETSGKRINKTRVTVGVSLQAQTPGPWIP